MRSLLFSLLLFSSQVSASETAIRLYPGFVTKLRCEGKLLISSVGNDSAVRLEALPRELGCGVLLKPISSSAMTNVILETSTGTIRRLVEVQASTKAPTAVELEYRLKGDES